MTDAHGTNPEDPYYNENAVESRLWDNQYVYDQIIEAAQRNGTQIITDLDLEENAQNRSFTLASAASFRGEAFHFLSDHLLAFSANRRKHIGCSLDRYLTLFCIRNHTLQILYILRC